MATLQVTVDDAIKQNADRLFGSLGLDTATAIQIFLRAAIEHDGIPFPVHHRPLPEDLMEAVADSRQHRNLHGPFDSAEEAVASMLED
ncbi:MAG: type II toxin-antitoxin system RelB/DinJ family antitoxin [Schwartzia sp.]|nr:type II toxin-antitoxin system RelB/DinJ family antitoxin [Schwartzia sp. (in: firmicutes)]